MLFSLSLACQKKKKKKKTFFKNKYTAHNWDLVHCLPFRHYSFKKFGESSKPARLVTANSEQDPIIAH